MSSPSVYEHYKEHFACFHCRKMLRRTSWFQLTQEVREQHKSYSSYLRQATMACPHCGQTMYNMGKGFRPPKQKALRGWKALEKSAQSGERFTGWRW